VNASRYLPLLLVPALLSAEKMTDEDRLRIVRGLTAEYATAKIVFPMSKKPLEVSAGGGINPAKWNEAMQKSAAPAVKKGDMLQITRVAVNDDHIVMEINGGLKDGRSWRDRIQVGMGTGRTMGGVPIGSGQLSAGTAIVLRFDKPLSAGLEVAEIKKLLSPIMEFDLRSATEVYVENLPPEIQEAIKNKKAVEGMDREQVILAMGRPRYKSRETKDGNDFEDWVYGQAPGRITFVTFGAGGKVVKVKEAYASLGGGDLTAGPPPEY
jgi:hypothetical protein